MALTDVTVGCLSGETAPDTLSGASPSARTEGKRATTSVVFLPWFLQGFNISYCPLHSKMPSVQWVNGKKGTGTAASDLILAAAALIAPPRVL